MNLSAEQKPVYTPKKKTEKKKPLAARIEFQPEPETLPDRPRPRRGPGEMPGGVELKNRKEILCVGHCVSLCAFAVKKTLSFPGER